MENQTQIYFCPTCPILLTKLSKYSETKLSSFLVVTSKCNHNIPQNVDYEKYKNLELKCTNHQSVKGEFFCSECKKYFCQKCAENHNRKENHEFCFCHKKSDKICSKHNNAQLTNYCKHCNEVLCFNCLEDHKGHNISDKVEDFFLYSFDFLSLRQILDNKKAQLKQINDLFHKIIQLKKKIAQEIVDIEQIITEKTEKEEIQKRIKEEFVVINSEPVPIRQKFINLNKKIKVSNSKIFQIIPLSTNRFLVGSEDNTISFFDLSTNKKCGDIKRPKPLNKILVISDQKRICLLEGKSILVLYDANDLKVLHSIEISSEVRCLIECKEKELILAVNKKNNILIISTDQLKMIGTIRICEGYVKNLLILEDINEIYCLSSSSEDSEDSAISILNFGNKKLVTNTKGTGFCNNIVQLKNKCIVGYNKSNEVIGFDIFLDKTWVIGKHKAPITDIIRIKTKYFVFQEIVATSSLDREVSIWDCDNSLKMFGCYASSGVTRILEISYGRLIAVTNSKSIMVFDTENAQLVTEFDKLNSNSSAVTEINNEFIIVGLDDGYIQILN